MSTLILGIGNLLLGDEGIGVHVIKEVQTRELPPDVECLDGGTGGMHLLGPFQAAERVILVDATLEGTPGTVRKLSPRFSSEYPRSLTAHDIGLKDLLDALYLLSDPPQVTLFAVSIAPLGDLTTELSPGLAAQVVEIADHVIAEARRADEPMVRR